MRGIRDGVEVEWDISAVPPTAIPSASDAIVRPRDTRVEAKPVPRSVNADVPGVAPVLLLCQCWFGF